MRFGNAYNKFVRSQRILTSEGCKDPSAAACRRVEDRFLLPLLLGEKAGMRASNFLRQRRQIKSVRRNLSCTPCRLPVRFARVMAACATASTFSCNIIL
jgi:hypothetical protein